MAKRKESMMARQRRLLAEQRAKKAASKKGGAIVKSKGSAITKSKGSAITKSKGSAIVKSPGGKVVKAGKGGALAKSTGGKLAKAGKGLLGKVGKLAGRIAGPLAVGTGIANATFRNPDMVKAYQNYQPPKLSKGKGGGQGNSKKASSGPKKTSYPVQKGKVAPKKTKYPTAAETRAAEVKRKAASAPPKPAPKTTQKSTPTKSPRLPGKSVYDGKGGSSPAPKKPKSRLDKALDWASDSKNKDAWMGKKKSSGVKKPNLSKKAASAKSNTKKAFGSMLKKKKK